MKVRAAVDVSPAADMRVRLDALERRIAELEARFAPGDAADVAVLVAIVAAKVPQPFTSRAVLTWARQADDLAAALEGADVTNAIEAGKLLGRLTTRRIDGFAVERADVVRAGTRWRIMPRR